MENPMNNAAQLTYPAVGKGQFPALLLMNFLSYWNLPQFIQIPIPILIKSNAKLFFGRLTL